ncbi:unnamed protein product [Pylaiella littoralis]
MPGSRSVSDLSSPKHRESIEPRQPFDADADDCSISPSRPARSGQDPCKDDTLTCASRKPTSPSPFAWGAQGGLSYPAWPTAACYETDKEDDTNISSGHAKDVRPPEQKHLHSYNSEPPPLSPLPTEAVPFEAGASAPQTKKHHQQQRRQQQQQHKQKPEQQQQRKLQQQQPHQPQQQQQPQQQKQPQPQQPQPQQQKQQQQQQQEQQRPRRQQPRQQPRPQPRQQPRQQQQHQQQQRPRKGDGRGVCCQTRNCSEPPAYSEDGCKPAVRCRYHRRDGMFRVLRGIKACGMDGCTSNSKVSYMDQNCRIHRFCPQHQEPAIVLEQAANCQYGGCNGTPRYGTREGPLSFCPKHKRIGLFTVRDGEVYVATRDGSAFRKEYIPVKCDSGAAAGGAATGDAAAAELLEPATKAKVASPFRKKSQPVPASASPPALSERIKIPLSVAGKSPSPSRKLCEVSGCMVQPSYGEPGSTKPRFCSGHKLKNHISLKNRPCVFPGCVTRPHYGPSRGRPVFCVTHKKKSHVHLLKEAANLEKEELERKRRLKSRNISEKKDRPAEVKGLKNQGKKKDSADKLLQDVGKKDNRPKEKGKGKGPARGNSSARYPAVALVGKTAVVTEEAAKKRRKTSSGGGSSLPAEPAAPPRPPPSSSSVSSPVPSPPAALDPVSASAAAPNTARHNGGGLLDVSQSQHTMEMPTPGMTAFSDCSGTRLLQDGGTRSPREAAVEAANGSSSGGRRARAPSRKLLEASGKVADEGVQLLTKEKKQEEARLKMEMKEQRRAAKTAGLKLGEVIEATALPPSFSGEETGGSGSGGGASWDSDKSGAFNVTEATLPNLSWRKLSPAEILKAAQQQQQQKQQQKQEQQPAVAEAKHIGLSVKDTETEEKGGAVATAARQQVTTGELATPATATTATEDGNKLAKKRKGEGSPASPEADTGSGKGAERGRPAKNAARAGKKDHKKRFRATPRAAKRQSPRIHGEVERPNKAKGGTARGKIACEFKNCSEPASYGVGDTVRYCKAHKIATGK